MDLNDLDRQIKIDPHEDVASIRTDDIAWNILAQNVYADKFPEFEDQFNELQTNITRHNISSVFIPTLIATDLKRAIAATLVGKK